ncbi:MAG: ABC transporter permease [Planctomycetota bacterium]|jgi:lipoprotein-releasing system permease protein|nr:MAG: ABC transporter permease [Planctomycetota bacterium]
MYKLLLATKYLKTRVIAFVSIISVTLGVATMIVVNSVMAGFQTEMQDRLRGLLSDVAVMTHDTDGFEDPDQLLKIIHECQYVEATTPTVEMWGMMSFRVMGQEEQRPVRIVGILPEGKNQVSPLAKYLLSRQDKDLSNRDQVPEVDANAPVTWDLSATALGYRKDKIAYDRLRQPETLPDGSNSEPQVASETPLTQTADSGEGPLFDNPDEFRDPDEFQSDATPVDPTAPQPARVFVGSGLVSSPVRNRETGEIDVQAFINPGEDVTLTTLKSGTPQPVSFKATVVDLFKCGMSEYDSNLVFVNLEQMQKARGMLSPPDPKHPNDNLDWQKGSVTAIQIKLTDYSKAPLVVQFLREKLADMRVSVETWEQQQGPLLQAVEVERAILNVLLFLIIAVAGFGILAIFYMIVVEKTRDIGILKALGASSRGVMSIFLLYGLTLGLVGSLAGVILGLTFVRYIDSIEECISMIIGRKVFDETIYYFHQVPTKVNPGTVIWVALGAIAIAVLASILPARRAAQLHPVQALRYE